MLPALAQRVAAGRAPPGELEARVWGARLRRLAPSARVEVVREGAQRGQVTRLDLDRAEERYLLAASGDGTVGLYDLAEGDGNYGAPRRPPSPQRPHGAPPPPRRVEEEGAAVAPTPVRVRCLQATPRGNNTSTTSVGAGAGAAAAAADGTGGMGGSLVPGGPPAASLLGHGHVVTTVQWYPLDTGLFVSGSSDGTVRVWDTNAFVTAGVFDLGAKVHAAAMSPAMRTHSLVAVGTDDRCVRLCDLKSGGSSHLLMGHSEAVLTAAWCPTQEHLLATGSRDATVRLWDVRRSGPTACLATLDQHADHHRRRAPGLMGGPTDLAKAHDGWVVSLAFTPNGSGLLSAGTDKRLRLWNAATGEHSLRNFRGTRNDRPLGWSITAIQPGAAATGAVLYPNGSSGDVHLYPLFGDGNSSGGSSGGSGSQGRPWHVLRGHLDAVSSAVYRRDAGQVVTGGADALVLVFDCSRHEAAEGRRLEEEEQEEEQRAAAGREQGADAWSSDEEEEEEEEEAVGGGVSGEGPRRRGFVPPIIQQLIAGGGTLPNPPPQTQPQENRSDDDDDGDGGRGRGRRGGGGGGGGSGGRGGNGGERKRSRDGRGGSSSRGRGRGRIRR